MPIAFVFITAIGCKKDVDTSVIEFGYDYYPVELGTYRIYEVDSIGHDVTSDTSQFQIRERVVEQFTDNLGQPSFRIERHKRLSGSDEWAFQTTWVEKKTTTFAQRVEENQRYIKMVFPVNEDQSWDGNAYNVFDPWMYRYTAIGVPKSVGLFNFSNTVTVYQRNNVNLVDQEIASEIYADGIGMIYKQLIDLNFQEDGLSGIELEMSILAYGVE